MGIRGIRIVVDSGSRNGRFTIIDAGRIEERELNAGNTVKFSEADGAWKNNSRENLQQGFILCFTNQREKNEIANGGSKIMKRKLFILITAVCLVFTAACNMYEIDKANKLVDEANKSINEANAGINGSTEKLVAMENAVQRIRSDEDLEAQQSVAKGIITTLEQTRDQYKNAGDKFESASKLKLPEKFKEYLDSKAKEMKKRGEVADAMIGEPQALINSDGKADYEQKVETVVAKFKSLKKEADDLEAKADKIYEENKSLFKAQ